MVVTIKWYQKQSPPLQVISHLYQTNSPVFSCNQDHLPRRQSSSLFSQVQKVTDISLAFWVSLQHWISQLHQGTKEHGKIRELHNFMCIAVHHLLWSEFLDQKQCLEYCKWDILQIHEDFCHMHCIKGRPVPLQKFLIKSNNAFSLMQWKYGNILSLPKVGDFSGKCYYIEN